MMSDFAFNNHDIGQGKSYWQTGGADSLKVLLVEHPASDHLQVLKHTQVSPLFWPSINV